MAGFLNAVSASFVLLLIMAVGYGMGRAGWMTAKEKGFVSKYVMNIAVPCNCVVSILNHLERSQLAQAGVMLVSAYLGILVTLLLAVALARLLKLPRERWGVFVTMGGMSNALFIGIPVCTQLFGEACMPFIMIYWLGNTSFLQSVGVMLTERSGTIPSGQSRSAWGFLKDLFTKPPIVATLAGVVLLLLGLELPGPIGKAAGYISASVSPMALIYCGYIVYEVGLKNLRFLRGLPTMLVLRLLVAPVLCLVFCNLCGVTGLARSVFVVESALPVPTQVTVMAGAYGADEKYAATGACLSILGGFLTIPLLMLILG